MEMFIFTVLSLVILQISVVKAETTESDIIGMAVAACAGFVLLTLVIAIVVMSLQWKNWLNNWMRLKGKVRMPRAYFKKKKEAKKRLISGSVGSQPSGQNVFDTATWVDDWRQRARRFPPSRVYEEKDATLELYEEVGDDDSEEFTIETEVVETSENVNNGSTLHEPSDKVSVKDIIPDLNTYDSADSLQKRHPTLAVDIAEPKGTVHPTCDPLREENKVIDDDSSHSDNEKIARRKYELVRL